MQLPIIDARGLSSGDPGTLSALRHACEALGFFYLAHHGVPETLARRLEETTRAFFSLPLEERQAIAMAHGGTAWRGYFPLRGELTSGLPDVKEGLYFGQELGPEDPRVRAGWPMHGANLFPQPVPGLRGAVLGWMEALEALAQRVMSGLAQSLGLPARFFAEDLTRQPLCLFRVFHYPPPAPEDAARWGVGEHTDYGLLTLLMQDDCGGLEVRTPRGWIGAPPLPGTFVCNLGDMLDRITGGRYRSTPHRVRNVSGRSRLSWPFFFDPGFDAEVRPLPGALARPAAQDAAERWDRASVHTLQGTYGDYLRAKVGKVFPALAAQLHPQAG